MLVNVQYNVLFESLHFKSEADPSAMREIINNKY